VTALGKDRPELLLEVCQVGEVSRGGLFGKRHVRSNARFVVAEQARTGFVCILECPHGLVVSPLAPRGTVPGVRHDQA
jgi:hypothetical protein